MTAQPDPYVRVYYRILDDPKFAEVYDNDAALATWVRLLLAADAMYPAPAHIPRGVKRTALQRLTAAELIDLLPGHRYRVHGLSNERERRREQASDAARARWEKAAQQRASQNGRTAPAMREHSASNANDMHSSPIQSEPIQSSPLPSTETGEEWDESVKDGADAYFQVTGRFPSDRILTWINRLTKLYTDELFARMLAKVYREDADPRTLMGRIEERLKAIYYRQHKDELKAATRQAELDALADIQAQEAAAWQECAECGTARRIHRGDHEFAVPA